MLCYGFLAAIVLPPFTGQTRGWASYRGPFYGLLTATVLLPLTGQTYGWATSTTKTGGCGAGTTALRSSSPKSTGSEGNRTTSARNCACVWAGSGPSTGSDRLRVKGTGPTSSAEAEVGKRMRIGRTGQEVPRLEEPEFLRIPGRGQLGPREGWKEPGVVNGTRRSAGGPRE